MVVAFKFNEIVPSEPGFGKSVLSSASSYSSYASCGLASMMVWKLPTPKVGLNLTLNSCSFWQATIMSFGVI
jgi:hypothetical protein